MKRTFTTLGELTKGDKFYFQKDKKKTIYECGTDAPERKYDKYTFKMRYFLQLSSIDNKWHLSSKSPKQGNVGVVKIEL